MVPLPFPLSLRFTREQLTKRTIKQPLLLDSPAVVLSFVRIVLTAVFDGEERNR
jgi:hypothetical protein